MLPTKHRLQKEKDFQRVYKGGRRFGSKYLTVISMPSDQNKSRFGFVVSKKGLGTLVKRNRLKRILRGLVKDLLSQIVSGHDVILIARATLLSYGPKDRFQILKKALIKAKLLDERAYHKNN